MLVEPESWTGRSMVSTTVGVCLPAMPPYTDLAVLEELEEDGSRDRDVPAAIRPRVRREVNYGSVLTPHRGHASGLCP